MAAKKKAAKKARKRAAKKATAAATAKPGMIRLPVPTIGRTVLFTGNNNVQEPAIITRGNDDPRGTVSLFILGEEGSHRAQNVPHSDEPHAGCWSWPPFVAPKEVEA